jgi:hypothetical protein
MLSSSLALKAHWKVFRNRDSSVLPRLVIPKIMSDKNSVDVLIPAQAEIGPSGQQPLTRTKAAPQIRIRATVLNSRLLKLGFGGCAICLWFLDLDAVHQSGSKVAILLPMNHQFRLKARGLR